MNALCQRHGVTISALGYYPNPLSANETRDYQDFAEALYGYKESLTLWEDNEKARVGLKQAQYAPLSVEDQLISIYAGTQGLLDEVEVAHVPEFESAMLDHFRTEFPEVLDEIREKKVLSDELGEQITKIVKDLQTHWQPAS